MAPMSPYILAIDQGTTSSRAILFDSEFRIVASDQKAFAQHFPASGWVEHDAEEIWKSVVETCRNAILKAGITASQIAGIGITNQRETVVVWDRETSAPVHRAIVWQDRRTADICGRLKAEGAAEKVENKTGLVIDPYFSATKIAWLLDNIEGARRRAENGRLLFGTIDSYLLWRMTGGASHRTDATNASRTLLFNIHENCWDDELLALFEVPEAVLPQVEDCASTFGTTNRELFGTEIPILGVAGDQQAATMGQACFEPGMVKSTYGTGCFVVLNTGCAAVRSNHRLLSTIACRLGGKTTYALEGSIFIAGATLQWLRDGLGVIEDAADTGGMAEAADNSQDLILVPAFAGLGAPHWNPDARGTLFGLTRNSGPNEFVHAALESVCFQTRDLMDAMNGDYSFELSNNGLRVDGGMAASDWTMQFLADILDCKIERPKVLETTALGAAWLAGMQAGIWPDQKGFASSWKPDRRFSSHMSEETRCGKLKGWRAALGATLHMTENSR